MTRRCAVVATLVAIAAPAAAETTQPAEFQPKKDRERAQRSTKHGRPPAPGTKPGKLVNLYNQWTHDWLAVDPGQLPSLDQVNRFLRDHFTNEATTMDAKLIGAVIAAARDFKSDVVNVVSGFRHPKYNLMLRKKGRQVARDSQHTHGTAVDFRIPRVPVRKLEQWAKAQKLGGVGVYTSSGFIHMDTGPIRSWSAE
jgi:uncharacterized protein YcbK (DUF882 family)